MSKIMFKNSGVKWQIPLKKLMDEWLQCKIPITNSIFQKLKFPLFLAPGWKQPKRKILSERNEAPHSLLVWKENLTCACPVGSILEDAQSMRNLHLNIPNQLEPNMYLAKCQAIWGKLDGFFGRLQSLRRWSGYALCIASLVSMLYWSSNLIEYLYCISKLGSFSVGDPSLAFAAVSFWDFPLINCFALLVFC